MLTRPKSGRAAQFNRWAGDKNGTLFERHFDSRPQKCRAFADRRREGKEQLGAADTIKLLEEAAKQIEDKMKETE